MNNSRSIKPKLTKCYTGIKLVLGLKKTKILLCIIAYTLLSVLMKL